MVKLCPPAVFLLLTVLVGAQDLEPLDRAGDIGPVVYGDGGGRIWKWTGGEKAWLSPEGRNLILGGVGEESLWGWNLEGDRARFFTLALPKKTDQKSPPPEPVFELASFLSPDRADKVGDRLLLVWGTKDGHPRYEVWKAGEKHASRAWDDGRTVYALALGPEEGWLVAGRTLEGLPWLELSGNTVPAPEGWRGRLTVTAWVPEKDTAANLVPPTVHPWAAGWGAPGAEPPQPLFWGPEGWTRPDPGAEPLGVSGVYPLLGAGGDQGTLELAGWQADIGTGALRPWFWDGEAGQVPGGAADGQPQAFSTGGKGGPFLVVRHQSAPWFTLENGKESIPMAGLEGMDRVVSVEADSKASP